MVVWDRWRRESRRREAIALSWLTFNVVLGVVLSLSLTTFRSMFPPNVVEVAYQKTAVFLWFIEVGLQTIYITHLGDQNLIHSGMLKKAYRNLSFKRPIFVQTFIVAVLGFGCDWALTYYGNATTPILQPLLAIFTYWGQVLLWTILGLAMYEAYVSFMTPGSHGWRRWNPPND